MKPIRLIFFSAVIAAAACLFAIPRAQTPAQPNAPQPTPAPESRSVWDGVYTEKQVLRGQALYTESCSTCHGEKLGGDPEQDIPALTGSHFKDAWNGRTVDALFKKISRTMPQDDPGRLTAQQTADAVAFILSANGFPNGENDLPPDPKILAAIRIATRKSLVIW